MAASNSWSRRKFLKTSLAATGAIAVSQTPFQLLARKRQPFRLTVLHTNDVHSRIEPFEAGEYAGLGGFARRAKLIEQIRQQEENVLLLDAGDIWQGTPYFNVFGGKLEFQLMSRMRYDAATIGNHDFDRGLEGLKEMLPHARFPFISSNYDFSSTMLENLILPYRVVERGGLRIGIYGLGVELQGLVPGRLYGDTKYLDPVEVAQRTEQHLKEQEKCDFIIALSHLGYEYESDKISDLKLAPQLQWTDLIIGGHTHTFLTKPTRLETRTGRPIWINQVGWAGIHLGRIDFLFSEQKRVQTSFGAPQKISEYSSR